MCWSEFSGIAGISYSALAAALCFLPHIAFAQVVISEFMYDYPGSDTGQEWVELFNVGTSPVDLTKWKINDGSGHLLNVPPKNGGIGSITIASGGYLLLADNAPNFEAAYPNVANVIDTTLALPNTSGTISLIDDNGATVDSLAYTKDAGAAGDGNTYQRGSVSATTLAASAPTPGTGSLVAQTTSQDEGTDTGTATTQTSVQASATLTPAAVSSYVPPPVPQLFADAGNDRGVIVGADFELDGRAYDRNQHPLDTATTRFSWNFGDGQTAEGPAVLHHFDYPGRYVVVLSIANDRLAVSDHIVITAEPAALDFSVLPDGGVAIQNKARHDLDLSQWIVRASSGQFAAQFILPPHSMILSGATMRITSATLKFRADASSELDYPNGMQAIGIGETETMAPASPPAPVAPSVPAPVAKEEPGVPAALATTNDPKMSQETSAGEVEVATSEVSEEPTPISVEAPTSSQVALAAQTMPQFSHFSWWWAAAAALAALGGGAMFVSRAKSKHEWDIEEVRE